MNCTELKIWIENATETEIISAEKPVLDHISSCPDCKVMYESLSGAFHYMEGQRNKSLPPFKSKLIIGELNKKAKLSTGNVKALIFISKIAAAIIISLGLITGTLAGGIISKKSTEQSDPWNSEFALLTEESGYNSYLFD